MSYKLQTCCIVVIIIIIPSVILQELVQSHQVVLSILKSEDYSNNLVPPVSSSSLSSSSSPLKVYINLGLREIESIDDRKMELKLQLSLRQKWTDPRLQYASAETNGYVTLNGDITYKPWSPDVFVRNEKATVIHSVTRPNSFFRIYPNGTVYYSTKMSLTISCFMNLRKFPFDRQTCDVHMSTYGYTTNTIEFHWESNDTSVEQVSDIGSVHLPQFRLVDQTIGRCLFKNAAGNFSAVYVSLAFKRQLAYYNVQLFIPCSMLIMITWVTFWLGSAVEARLSLTVTVLLTLSTQIAGLNQSLAQVSYLTGFSVFQGTCLTFAVMSILESATVFFITYERNGKRLFGRGSIRKNDIDLMVTTEKGNLEEHSSDRRKGAIIDRRAQRLDELSRVVFPVTFLIFLTAYFASYLWDYGSLDEQFVWNLKRNTLDDYNKSCKGSK